MIHPESRTGPGSGHGHAHGHVPGNEPVHAAAGRATGSDQVSTRDAQDDPELLEARPRECPECGLMQRMPVPPCGGTVQCPRCDEILRRRRTDSLTRALAMAVAALALLAVAATAPFLSFRLTGQERETTMAALPQAFTAQGMPELTWLVAGTILLAPLAKLVFTILILAGLRLGAARGRLAVLARWRAWIGPWSMVEVFLLGTFVAYTRLKGLAYVETGPALYALGLLMLAMVVTDALLDEEAMWDAIRPARPEPLGLRSAPMLGCDTCGLVSRGREGMPCPRCGAGLRRRKPDTVQRTWALLAAAAALYLPANIYPVMTVIRLGQGGPHTIVGGAFELLEGGLWPLALLVFVASVLVPMFKLVGLAFLLLTVRSRWAGRLRERTRLYRVIDVIGRWSMIDVFMLAVLVALVQSGTLAAVIPGLGAVSFAGVVVLTMLAAASFDPRAMWDAAGMNGQAEPGAGAAGSGAAAEQPTPATDTVRPAIPASAAMRGA